MSKNLIKSNNNKLSNFVSNLEEAQNVLIENNHLDFIHGDGKKLVTHISDEFKIENCPKNWLDPPPWALKRFFMP